MYNGHSVWSACLIAVNKHINIFHLYLSEWVTYIHIYIQTHKHITMLKCTNICIYALDYFIHQLSFGKGVRFQSPMKNNQSNCF